MHDIAAIRKDPEKFDRALAGRGLAPRATEICGLDTEHREALTTLEGLRAERTKLSKDIGKQRAAGADTQAEEARVRTLKGELESTEAVTAGYHHKLVAMLMELPNIPDDDVPVGASEGDNEEQRRWGAELIPSEPPHANYATDHDDVGHGMGQMHLDIAAKLAGSRFVLLSGGLARLERALANFMLDVHTSEHGYTEVSPPALVNTDTMTGTGQLPKFAEDLFRAGDRFWLIPTAEVPLTSIVADDITDADTLPYRFAAWTPCFRSEAGSAGRDTKGILRVHQFSKVEMVSITRPEDSARELERMTECAENILKKLELPFRTLLLCTGDMGFGARKTYDLEVWVPSQKMYREISSCSNCGDFQARRMGGRLKRKHAKGTEFVHSLNGSGLAVGRTLLALIESGMQEDNSIHIPEVLRPYMGGAERIAPNPEGLPTWAAHSATSAA